MNHSSFRLCSAVLIAASCFGLSAVPTHAAEPEWVSLFDGKTLDGWKVVGRQGTQWEVKDGVIVSGGDVSMLTTTTGPYQNFSYRAEVKINDGGNSGLYFRTKDEPGFLDGYEAQIDSNHTDPIRTGSLYGMCHIYKDIVAPDTWFTYQVDVKDDNWRGRDMTRIRISINGEELYEYFDFAKTYPAGQFAFQQHDPKSSVSIRKVEIKVMGE